MTNMKCVLRVKIMQISPNKTSNNSHHRLVETDMHHLIFQARERERCVIIINGGGCGGVYK